MIFYYFFHLLVVLTLLGLNSTVICTYSYFQPLLVSADEVKSGSI